MQGLTRAVLLVGLLMAGWMTAMPVRAQEGLPTPTVVSSDEPMGSPAAASTVVPAEEPTIEPTDTSIFVPADEPTTIPLPAEVQSIEASCLSSSSVDGVVYIANPDGTMQVGLGLQQRYRPSQHITLWPTVALTTVTATVNMAVFSFIIPEAIQGETFRIQVTSINGEPVVNGIISPTFTCGPAPTVVPTNMPTIEPTATSTVVPTSTPSPTATATSTITATATVTATATSTITATATVTATATATVTATATATSTQPVAAGQLHLTLLTDDGGPIPDTAVICIGDLCTTAGDGFSVAAVSGSSRTLELTPGAYAITVTNVFPYADGTDEVTILAGESTSLDVLLNRVVPPTQPGGVTPEPTPAVIATIAPTIADGTGASQPTATATTSGSSHPTVTALPTTGAGELPSSTNAVLLLIATATVMLAGVIAWQLRRRLG